MTERDVDQLERLAQINQICREFRQACVARKLPRIEDFLPLVSEPAREALFSSLLEAEVLYRHKARTDPTSAEYLQRFPQFAKQVRQAFFEPTLASLDEAESKGGNIPPGSLSEAHVARATAPTLEVPAANRLGDYELIRELGRGGMGIVFEARHAKSGNRVALKMLPAGVHGQEVNVERLYRFRREFRSLAEINHPNLVGMQTLEVVGNQWFFTMDLVRGEDFLSHVRPRNVLDEGRLRKALSQLVRGMTALHERRIVHRDVKPSNVLVEADGTVRILDFGMVAEMQQATDLTQSRSARFVGTPKYAAPEQMFGQRSEVSDWYAVGVMLYEALTGEAPFSGRDALETLRRKHQEDAPALAGRADLPADLALLSDGLLKREPLLRLSSAAIAELLHIESETKTHGTTGTTGSTDSHGSAAGEEGLGEELRAGQDEELVLIGREEQLARLEAARQELLQARRPVVVWITGQSGEGKSSLAEKFLAPLRKGTEMLVLSGRCYDRESVPFKAIDSVVAPLVSFLRSRAAGEVANLLPEDMAFLARLFPLLRRVEPIAAVATPDPGHMESEKVKYRAFQALRQLLVSLSSRWPVAILIDDLQWADADSSAVLLDLVTGEGPPAVLLLGSYRRDEAAESPFLKEWRAARERGEAGLVEHVVEVHPLSRAQCLELAAIRTGGDRALLEKRADELLGESGGNPYFFEQLLEGFDPSTGRLQRVPLEELIDARLGKLPREAAALLEMVAVSGQPLDLDLASRAAELDPSAIAIATHMRSERLLRIVGSGDVTRVDTYHDKIRETALARLSSERRRNLHLRLAETIESQDPLTADQWRASLAERPHPGDYPQPISHRVFDLAHHFHAAESPKAFVYQLLAAEQTLLAYAVDDALAWYERVLELIPDDATADLRYRIWMAKGAVYRWSKAARPSCEAYQQAFELATHDLAQALALAGLASVYSQSGKYRASLDFSRQALTKFGWPTPRSRMVRWLSLGFAIARILFVPAKWQVGRTAESRTTASLMLRSLDLSVQAGFENGILSAGEMMSFSSLLAMRTGDQQNLALGYAAFGNFFSAGGLHPLSKWLMKRVGQISANIGDVETVAFRQFYEGGAAYWAGDLPAATESFEHSTPTLLGTHNLTSLAVALHMRRHIEFFLGSSSKELGLGQAVLDVAQGLGNTQTICWGLYDIACAQARQGDLASAANYMRRANEALQGERYYMTEAIRLSTDAYVRLQCSDHAGAARLASNAGRIVSESWILLDVTMLCLPLLLEGLAGPEWQSAAERTLQRDLRRMLRRARLFYRALPNHQPHLLRVFGRAYWRLRRPRRATRCFEKAARLAAAKGMQYQRAKCLLDLAAVKAEGREENRAEAISLLKSMESVIPRAESWLLGGDTGESVVAPEFDLEAWERRHAGGGAGEPLGE